MRHAYLIMAHHNESQVANLLALLDHEKNDIYLHLDAKWKAASVERLRSAVHSSALYFVNRIKVSWGGDSQIKCELLLLKEAIKKHHDYYHLLSGDDLPIKPFSDIDNYFNDHNGIEFVGFACAKTLDVFDGQLSARFKYYFPFQNLLGRRFSRFVPFWVQLQSFLGINRCEDMGGRLFGKGHNWFSITHRFATYLVQKSDEIIEQYRWSLCCDEVFIQTELINSPFAGNRAPQNYPGGGLCAI